MTLVQKEKISQDHAEKLSQNVVMPQVSLFTRNLMRIAII